MLTSKEQLLNNSRALSYKPEILEKVYRLLDILSQILAVPYLRDRLVLKGGTALNLYFYQTLPRLSVDIDLNYVGELDRDKMLKETPVLDIHELAAGKLSALFNRTASRDLFDAHHLLTQGNLNTEKLKQALVVYLAMSKKVLLHPALHWAVKQWVG